MSISTCATSLPFLVDVVVFAGGHDEKLMPLTTSEPKAMLQICNKPMIWFCLQPWLEAGVRTFFLCVHIGHKSVLEQYLAKELPHVSFYFAITPMEIDDRPSTTCDAVKAYRALKASLRAEGAAWEGDASHPSPRNNNNNNAAGGGRGDTHLGDERAAMAGLERDAVLVSCDSILSGVRVEEFVKHFYNAAASVSVMLCRPRKELSAPTTSSGAATGGRGGAKTSSSSTTPSPPKPLLAHTFVGVAYEGEVSLNVDDRHRLGGVAGGEDGSINGGGGGADQQRNGSPSPRSLSTDGAASPSQSSLGGGTERPTFYSTPTFHRLHVLREDTKEGMRVPVHMIARRPNLTVATDVSDIHVYLLRSWVLRFIEDFVPAAGPNLGVRRTIIPFLAQHQHALLNASTKVYQSPTERVGHEVPEHWLHRHVQGMSVNSLNAATAHAHSSTLAGQDSLRIFCGIYGTSTDCLSILHRVNTVADFSAMSKEILSAKAFIATVAMPITTTTNTNNNNIAANSATSTSAQSPSSFPATPAMVVPGRCWAMACRLLPGGLVHAQRTAAPKLRVSILHSLIAPEQQQANPPSTWINTFISNSVIGPHASIGENCRITDSIIMDNVEIQSGARITNSLVGGGAVIESGATVSNTTVEPHMRIDASSS